ncbi:DNA polymerase III, delta prime subunit [Palleronia marisminoris]|uniref:DNA polymerase III subunit tau n=1 Tax=Palleronia marisminoris TaxID=315423 RepID=A0A1Y5SA55_9RHOB|nr:DNA polymerase III subunit delta' [Palleronia marisminoris]SFG69760.1 DNA polymerase III, delta prime subunit [Palleronia marisminoris]SLN35727.1 DNA polymerase III subunit tau [Palleronia marisminoris]
MSDPDPYEPDRVEGVPHPRHTHRLYGQEAAERALLDAYASEKMHHAWLLTGPRGVGKATLAWRIARFLIADPAAGGMFGGPETLDLPPDHPVAARVAALSEPQLFLMRPTRSDTGTERRDITVDVARGLRDFLHLSSTDGGRRVVIVDAADQLNTQAANAILKQVEEPPARTTFLLVCHAPARLLPTIRSRCRTLACHPLGGADLAEAIAAAGLDPQIEPPALQQLASGSVGEAARLLQEDGPAIYADLVALARTLPDMDRGRLLKLANGLAGAAGRNRMDTLVRLIELLLARLARAGAGLSPEAEATKGEAEMLARLAPHPAAGRAWAHLSQEVSARLGHGRAVNLDPSALVLDTGLKINETGRQILRG